MSKLRLCIAILIVLCAACPVLAAYPVYGRKIAPLLSDAEGIQNSPEARRRLERGDTIKRDIEKDERHTYLIALTANQYLRISVEQHGSDLALRLYNPAGQMVSEVTRLTTGRSYKPISTIATAAGDYRLEISAERDDQSHATYDVNIEQLQPATGDDVKRTAADRLFAEAELLRIQETKEASEAALKKYMDATALFNGIGDHWGEANTMMNAGIVLAALSRYPEARELFVRAEPFFKEMDDGISQAEALNNIAYTYFVMGDPQQAIETCFKSRAIYKAIGDLRREGEVINNIGSLFLRTGDTRQAIAYFNQGLAISRETKNKQDERSVLNRLGAAYDDLGEPRQALDNYNLALGLAQEMNAQRETGLILAHLGILYRSQGDSEKAIENLSEALTAVRAAGDRLNEAATLNNLGRVYGELGEVQKASEYYEQALTISAEIKDPSGQAAALNNLATIFLSQGDAQAALEQTNKALELAQAANDRSTEARTLVKVGNAYDHLNRLPQALESYGKALDLLTKLSDKRWQAVALASLGSALQKQREPEQALQSFEQAQAINLELGELPAQADVLYRIALVKRDLGRLNEARTAVEAAIAAFESVRSRIADPDLQAVYLASKRDLYDLQVELLMQLHAGDPSRSFNESALQVTEHARARSLLDMLTEAHFKVNEGADAALVERRAALQQQINAKDQYRMRLLARKHTVAQITEAEKELDQLVAAWREASARIRASSPRYLGLIQPSPLGVRDIQQQLLDNQTLLLVYWLGKPHSYVWAVTADSITSYVLPERAIIETEAKQFYELLTARNHDVAEESNAQWLERIRTADKQLAGAAAALSRLIVGPVGPLLGKKRLVIVGDGALQYIPFGALPVTTLNAAGKAALTPASVYVPLVMDHEIVSLPSASVLATLRHKPLDYKPAHKALAIFADPVFSENDPRVDSGQAAMSSAAHNSEIASGTASTQRLVRASQESGLLTFRRLRFSREEADQLARLVSQQGRLEATDFAANKSAAIHMDIADYRVLHFATHTLLNSTTPELSGIVLSLVDEKGAMQDGFLRLSEIYNLKLNAELVVLSACQTALGKEIKSEGMIGLTRGFMYAGAPRVVASLWNVDDRATSELMKRFYKAMLIDGLRPAAALRAAQIALFEEQGWQTPYYWAAFTLQGEWK